ncbi:hypothetical protein QQS21_001568 [Conoideocrella luteorostrata]|uniref:Fibroin-3 related protein n=1 Tax=Conoideocrella luteorostrata TaxID=1105319 RepID=A0AAJ0G201_9HYPO|nr:hypothetical protein QQS21_001568 [Conoideocrella luteorostrata]
MPSVDVAMARSLRPRAWELIKDALVRRVAQDLVRRNIVEDTQTKITDVKTAFSSWDNCMKASFCKYEWPNRPPIIAVIIVGGLIIFSILWCIIRCACCGLSCCCNCFQCLKCCGNCCGCCDPPGGRKNKYLDEPYIPPHHGYRTEAPMQAHFPPPAPAKYEPPQYAEFDVSKKGGEDSLPQMPGWEQGSSKKVMMEEEVEMSNLKKSPTLDQNRQRMNAPSPGPVSPMSPMSMHHGNRPYGGLPGSSSGQMSNHSQQALVPNQQSPGYNQPRQGPYGARDQSNNNNYFANRQSAGFGLDEPYDEPTHMSDTAVHGRVGQQNQPYGALAQQPYDDVAKQPYGAAVGAMWTRSQSASPHNPHNPYPYGASEVDGSTNAMGVRNQSASPYNQPYTPPPVVGAALGPGGRQSPVTVQARGQLRHGQDQIHEQFAEMPSMPHSRNDSVHTPAQTHQTQVSPTEHTAPMELAGSTPPEGYGLRRPGTGENSSSVHSRPPYGMDPRMRNSPGPRQTPGPRGESPYSRPPRGSPGPRYDQGYGRPSPQSPRNDMNRGYSPAPPRQFTPGPERRFSPGPERQYSPAPERQRTPGPHPLSKPVRPPINAYAQSPPQSPITNNAGFDFTSGYARPQDNQYPPGQPPTAAAYPGQKSYQPGR